MDLPIMCTLTPEEMRERRRELLEPFRAAAFEVEQLANGCAYTFHPTSSTLMNLARLVDLERQCCPFLSFRIAIEPQRNMRLEITGPQSASGIIADFFGS